MKKMFKIGITLLLVISLVSCKNDAKGKDLEISENGTFDKVENLNNLFIEARNTIIKNKEIQNDLIITITEDTTVALSNVSVLGTIQIRGNGQIVLNIHDSIIGNIEVTDTSSQIKVLGSATVENIKTNSKMELEEQEITKSGVNNLMVNAISDFEVTLLNTGLTTFSTQGSGEITLLSDSKTLIDKMVADSALDVFGNGIINLLIANAKVNYSDTIKPNEIILGENGKVNDSSITSSNTTTSKISTSKPNPTTTNKVTTTKKQNTTSKVTTSTTTTTTKVTTSTSPKNTAPVITASDITLKIGDVFNPLANVTMYDEEDGKINVTSANIISNNVNTAKEGVYYVEYICVDNGGMKTAMQRKVVVEAQNNNIWVEFNSSGIPVLYWNADSGATRYEVYYGDATSPFEKVDRRYNYLELNMSDLEPGIKHKLIVRSVTSSGVRTIGDYLFLYDKDKLDYSKSWQASDYNDMFIKFNPATLPTGNYTISIQLTTSTTLADVDFISLGDNITTDKRGVVSVKYDRNKGLSLEPIINIYGDYVFSFTLIDAKGNKIRTIDASVSVGDGKTNDKVTSEVLTTYTGNWLKNEGRGYEVRFYLDNDLDLNGAKNDIIIDFYYKTQEASSYEKISVGIEKFGYSGIIKRNTKLQVAFNCNIVSVSVEELITEYLKKASADQGIDVYAEILVTYNGVTTKTKSNKSSITLY